MKLSQVTPEHIKEYLRLESDTNEETIQVMIDAAKSYIMNYTGQNVTELNEFDDVSIAMMILVSEFYDNRRYMQDRNYSNKAVDIILDMHSVNFL